MQGTHLKDFFYTTISLTQSANVLLAEQFYTEINLIASLSF